MKKFRSQKGFSLVEVVIAMFMTTFVLLGLASHVGTVAAAARQDRMTTVATQFYQDKVESFKGMTFVQVANGNDSTDSIGTTYNRQWTVTSIAPDLKQVALTVSWANDQKSMVGSIIVATK